MESIIKHRNRWKKEKGLTLIEVIVALTILVTVSVAVVSILIYSTNSLSSIRDSKFFTNELTNIAEYYLSYDSTNYKKAVQSMTGTTIVGDNTDRIYYATNYSYSDSEDYQYYISFTYSESELTLTAYNKQNNSIATRSVTR